MRVLRLRRRDDAGAVAVFVALLTVVLVGVSSFAVDFGGAYVAKRNASTAADASSLAAAKELAKQKGTCASVLLSSAVTTARGVGDAYLAQNVPNATRNAFDVTCDATSFGVDVHYGANNTSPRALGGIFGGTGDYQVARDATTNISVAGDVTGLRPYMICSTDLTTLADGLAHEIDYPNAVCGNESGNWYSVDCPSTGASNSNPVIASNTLNGCDDDIAIIDTSSATTDAERVTILKANCPGLQASPGCLTGNTGNLPNNNITDAWDQLIGKDILVPVFLPGSVTGSGNGATYPVYAFAGVHICGYHWQNKSNSTTAGTCSSAAFTSSGNFDALLMIGTTVISSGSTKSASCALGNLLCDFGARTIHLVK